MPLFVLLVMKTKMFGKKKITYVIIYLYFSGALVLHVYIVSNSNSAEFLFYTQKTENR